MIHKSDPSVFLKSILDTMPPTQNRRSALQKGATDLQNRYNALGKSNFQDDDERRAYVRYRLPATFAVMTHVLGELGRRIGHIPPIDHHLDLGAGPGTVSLALWACGIHPKTTTMVEHDAAMNAVSAHLLAPNPHTVFHYAAAAESLLNTPAGYDIITASYALSEWDRGDRMAVLSALWPQVSGYFIVVEPGTPKGFAVIRDIRDWVINAGGSVIAPCPHQESCPLLSGDWCHFSKRVHRDKWHQSLKKGTLSYEDEKFSYAIFTRNPPSLIAPLNRVIKKPIPASGHRVLDLCTKSGTLERRTVSAREKDRYKIAKKTAWGDTFPDWPGKV